MLQQRRMKNSMSEIEERKKQARKEREMKASALAANLSCKYPDELKFNLQPRQTGDGILLSNTIIRRALGEFQAFSKVLRVKESHLLLGLDSTIPGTPEVNDVDFENPLNGSCNDIFSKPGKNGTNNHIQEIKKVVENAKNKSYSDFVEPKGKAEPPKVSKPVAKPKPPRLEVRKPTMDSMIKNPNNIESILKEMTQPLPPALTDIETPGKGTSKMFWFPQDEPLQPLPDNDLDRKPTENGGTSQEKEDSTVKLEPYPDVVDSNSSFKKAESGKTRVPPVKASDSRGAKTKPSRKFSTSSTSSSDDSSSDSSGSSDSENEKVEKQKKIPTATQPSAINSPLNQISPSSKMHKTKSPFNNNNNYIPNNKENNIHPGLSIRSYADINLKQKSIHDGFPYNNSSDMSLNDVVQVVTEDSSLMVNNSSLFPSPIGKTISPLDSENLFSDLIEFPEPNFLDEDLLIPSKNDVDFDSVSTENPVNSRVKPPTNHEDYKDPLDDSFESTNSTNLILNKKPIKYKKDSKDNEKKPSTDERNKSSSKSNETKDKSKSKSTRTDSGPSVKVNSGSKGHTFRTKAELKSMPKQRRKSISESSDDSKSRKSKETFKKGSSSEKEVKKEKKDRLKAKVSRESKDVVISVIEDKNSPNDKKTSNLLSSTPTKPTPVSSSNCYVPTDTLPSMSKSPISSLSQDTRLTNPISSIKDITPVIPPLKSPTNYTVEDLKVEDKCDLFLDDKGNIFDTIKNSITNRISPLISPVCYPHGRDIMEDGTFDEPSIQESEAMKLEVKDENDVTGYESPLKFPQDLLTAVELKPSPVHTTCEEENASVHVSVNASVNDINFVSPRNTSVNDFNFTSQPSSSVMDFISQSNSSVNSISLTHVNSSLDNLDDFNCPGNTSINTSNFSSEINSSANKLNFTPVSSSRNNFCSQGNDLIFSSQPSDHLNVVNIPSTYPPILIDEINTESSNLIVNSQDIKPENTELLIDLDPYSVKDIENIVPVSVNDQMPATIDLLPSEDTSILPVSTFNDTNLPKLTIKIPLHKLKNKYKKHNTCNDVQTRNTVLDSSLSSGLDEDLEIDVENIGSPLKRKRKVHRSSEKVSKCNIEDTSNNTIDCNKRVDNEFETPNKEQYEKLIISISLAKLKRAPLKGASSGDQTSKEKRSPKVRPPKICKLNTEPQVDLVTTDAIIEDVVMREESPAPFVNSNTPASLPPSSPLKLDEMETENCHQNDVSQHDSSLEKDTKKRGRPRKEKVSSKAEVKPEVKPMKNNSEISENKSCESSDDVCRECGTLRKDYGRDSRRINSYKNTYSNYYNEGRRRKHEADNSKIPTERAHKYIEAVLKYVQYLIGLELAGKMKIIQGVDEYMQITSECIQLVDYVITKYGRKENSASQSYDARFTLLCFRLQSILYLKLFKIKKESATKYSKVLSRYFKQFKAAGHNGPMVHPKPVHNRGSTGTPSPSSPSPGPSPGGSVASIGSAGSSGSTGSNDVTANGVGQYVTIPTDVHEKAFQHLQCSRNLLHGHLLWEDSELYASQCQPFLIKLSRRAGQLTMQSSMLHVVDYVTAGLEIIKELPPS